MATRADDPPMIGGRRLVDLSGDGAAGLLRAFVAAHGAMPGDLEHGAYDAGDRP